MGRGARSTTKKPRTSHVAPSSARPGENTNVCAGDMKLEGNENWVPVTQHPLAPTPLGYSQPPTTSDKQRAELFSLSRDMVLASISVGVIFTSPSAVRDVVRCAREFISEVNVATPPPPRATRPRYEGGETAEAELDDLAL